MGEFILCIILIAFFLYKGYLVSLSYADEPTLGDVLRGILQSAAIPLLFASPFLILVWIVW